MFFFCLAFGFVASSLWAQFDHGGAKTYEKSHRHSGYLEMPFRHDDLALGGTYRHSISGDQFLGAFVSFYGRPYGKVILVKAGPRFYFQPKEYRYVLGTGLDKKFWISNRYDLFIGAGFGLTLVDYRGTSEGVYRGHKLEKKEGLVPIAHAGVSYKFSRYVFVRVGGQYMNMKTTPGFRAYLAVGGQL